MNASHVWGAALLCGAAVVALSGISGCGGGASSLAFPSNTNNSPAPAALAISTTALADAEAGTEYTQALAATGGTSPYIWTSTALPAGLDFSAAGVFSGSALAAETVSITFTVTDSATPAATDDITLDLEIADVPAPATGWTAMTTTSAPEARSSHIAIWSGTYMVVWGGSNSAGDELNTGGRYDPSLNSWLAMDSTGAPEARDGMIAVWTGDTGNVATSNRMLVWGGYGSATYYATGGLYDPDTNTWSDATTHPNLVDGTTAPDGRSDHVGVWTGDTGNAATAFRLVVWGGSDGATYKSSGGIYDPATDTWTQFIPATTTGATLARDYASAAWDGATTMLVFGGIDNSGNEVAQLMEIDPFGATAEVIAATSEPVARGRHVSALVGPNFVVFGGLDGGTPIGTGGVIDPLNPTAWTATATTNQPSARHAVAAAVSDDGWFIFGGGDPATPLGDGAIWDWATDTWTAVSATNAPAAREFTTAVWTGAEFIVWGGIGAGATYLNSGSRYVP